MSNYMSPEIVITQYEKCSQDKQNFMRVWQDISDLIVPTKNDILNVSIPGESKYNNIYDNTPIVSNEYLAGALHGMLTSPTSPFFGLSTGNLDLDNDDDVREWIQDVVRTMHDQLNNSNFQTEVHEYYINLCGFGNGPLLIEEDVKEMFRFSSRSLKEVCIHENSKGYVDTFYRSFKYKPRDFMDEFDQKDLPQEIKDDFKNGKTNEREVIHTVYPRELLQDYTQSKFPFISQYVLREKKINLSVGGYREFPLVFGRWSRVSGEDYGRGPGERALPSARTLNEMKKTTIRGAQKVVDPPVQMPDDGFVLPLITRPSGINYYRAGSQDRVESMFNDSRIDFGYQAMDREIVAIREAFYVDQLKLREGPQMTATEVQERIDQALKIMAPMLGRQQSEFLAPLIMRCYGIMERRGAFKKPPPKITGKLLKIYFSSVMAQALRSSEITNIQRTFQATAPLVAVNPNVMDNVNADKTFKRIAKLQNFPQECLNKEGEVQKIRQQKQEAAQQQAAMAKAQASADTVGALSQAAKNVQPG